MALGQLCPQRNGNVVFQARALYSEIYDDLTIFNDDSCLEIDSTYIADRHSPTPALPKGEGGTQNYKVYPNPNDGNFVMQQYIADNDPVRVSIYDAVGRKMFGQEIQFANARSSLNLNNYVSGIYLLEITDSKNRTFRFKFVIDK